VEISSEQEYIIVVDMGQKQVNPKSGHAELPQLKDTEGDFILRTGEKTTVKPYRGDASRLQEFYRSLSQESQANRFSRARDVEPYLQALPQRMRNLRQVIAEKDGRIIGVAEYTINEGEYPNFGIAVADQHQRKGVGTFLMKRLIQDAMEEGYAGFTVIINGTNTQMIRTVKHLKTATVEEGEYDMGQYYTRMHFTRKK
jgi:GNAT superfamily N-acetyltransferase